MIYLIDAYVHLMLYYTYLNVHQSKMMGKMKVKFVVYVELVCALQFVW